MNRNTTHNHERGQAIVIIVIGMVAMLAFTAMAIDGGMVYTERRDAQNAADQAALAGALAYIQASGDKSTAAISAAVASATTNGFTNGVNGDDVTVTVLTPAADTYPGQQESDRLVQVDISHSTETALIQLFVSSAFRNTVKATARVSEGIAGGGGNNAILTTSSDCAGDSGFSIVGSSTLLVDPGGIHVNSSCSGGFDISGGADLHVHADFFTVVADDTHIVGSPDYGPEPITGADPLADPYASLTPPTNPYGATCDSSYTGGYDGNLDTLTPGYYCSVSMSNTPLELEQGVYVFDHLGASGSGSVTVKPGGSYSVIIINNSTSFSGNTVLTLNQTMLYYTGGGVYSFSGNAGTVHTPPTTGPYAGLSLWAGGASDGVHISGNTNTHIEGTYYAPNGDIQVNGSADTFVLDAQLVARYVKFTGSSVITMSWNGGGAEAAPPVIDLLR